MALSHSLLRSWLAEAVVMAIAFLPEYLFTAETLGTHLL